MNISSCFFASKPPGELLLFCCCQTAPIQQAESFTTLR
ncbi:hypothetical protein QFZ94_006056 [Paraburkholderia sp. JPY465]